MSVNAPLAVRGLSQPGRWSAFGAAFGVSATAAVTLLPALLSGSGIVAAVMMSAMASSAVVGAYLGRRWHRMVRRERGTTTVAQWIGRFAAHGAIWGTAAAWGAILPMAVAGAPLTGVAMAMLASAAVAGTAGAVVTSLLGVTHILDLTRGETPWKSLGLALVLGPTAFVGVTMFLAMIASILGLT